MRPADRPTGAAGGGGTTANSAHFSHVSHCVCLLSRRRLQRIRLAAATAVRCLAHMEGGKAGGRGREHEQNMGKSVCDSATLFEGDHNLYGFLDCPTLVMCTSFSFSPPPLVPSLSPRPFVLVALLVVVGGLTTRWLTLAVTMHNRDDRTAL